MDKSKGLINKGWKIKSSIYSDKGDEQTITLEGVGSYEIIWEGDSWKFIDPSMKLV